MCPMEQTAENSQSPEGRVFDSITILAYAFPPSGMEEAAFAKIAASIERTWEKIGMCKTVLVAHAPFKAAVAFAAARPDVELQVEPSLVPGDIKTMSLDCIKRLHSRFSTPYVLIVQNDGFPLRGNVSDFLGRRDFYGAPIICDGWKRRLCYALGFGSFNGGFSLRSRRLCAYASKAWFRFFRFVFHEDSRHLGEDFYYTTLLRLLPTTWLRYRFPSENEAFYFAFDALGGHVALPIGRILPFGFHGHATAEQLGIDLENVR